MIGLEHVELIKLSIAYAFVIAFIFTLLVTCLSLIGLVKFADQSQQKKLFTFLIVELVVICTGSFSGLLQLNANETVKAIKAPLEKEISSIQEHNIDLEKQITHTVGVLDGRHTYLKAVEIVKKAAKEGGKIINLRSTKDTKNQNKLYDTIITELTENSDLEFIRIITNGSDPHLWVLRQFLMKLGVRPRVTLVYTYAAQTMPSAFISGDELILGLLGKNRAVEHGLYIAKNKTLIDRFRGMYEELYLEENGFSIIVKQKYETVAKEEIDTKLGKLVKIGNKLGINICKWQEKDIPSNLKGSWISSVSEELNECSLKP